MPMDPGLIRVGERRRVTALCCSHPLSPQPERLGEKDVKGDLTVVCNCLRGGYREDRARLLPDRMRGNRPPAGKQEVLISFMEKIFPMRVVKHWNRVSENLWAINTSTGQGPE